MAETEHRAEGLGGWLPGALALAAATALWIAAIWLAVYRPDLLAPFGPELRLALLAVAWVVPFVLTFLAWLSLHQARQALNEARALFAETEALAGRLQEAGGATARAALDPPAAPPAAAIDDDVPRASREQLWAVLDFPRSESDTAGFEALRRAMAEDRQLALVIRTAQLVLSLLAQEGVHLEAERTPPPPPPESLRLYVDGARGAAIASLNAFDDRESLAATVGRMRRDPAFRTAAHRFVAAFETWLGTVAPEVDDAALSRIAASRSGRAFRLLGRATGSFG